jgi:lysophospholipase L1-like esterase
VVLASIPPTERFSWKPALKPAPEITALNHWLADFAHQRGLVFVDYTPLLATPTGALRPDLTKDGVHPNKAGYDLIEPLALKAIAEAQQTQERRSRRRP